MQVTKDFHMLGTVVSLLIAALIWWAPVPKEFALSETVLALFLIGLSLLFPLHTAIANAISWTSLQTVEQNLTPRLLSVYSGDRELRFLNHWIFLFPLLTLALMSDLLMIKHFPTLFILCIWIVLFGISLDALAAMTRKVRSYLDPFTILRHFSKEAKGAIDKDKDEQFCSWIEAISEVAVKAIYRTLPSLGTQAVDDLQKNACYFLTTTKTITHHLDDDQIEKGKPDHLSYTLFYLFQRMELINEKALSHKLEPVASSLITALGKITIAAAKVDLSLTSYPLHYMGRFAERAQKEHNNDIADKAICTFIEVSKTIVSETDLKYQDLKEPFFSIIGHMENITKESYRDDKTINIRFLTQPFNELKMLFQNEKVANHQDTPIIVTDINRVLGEFAELEMIMRTIPPLATSGDLVEKELQK